MTTARFVALALLAIMLVLLLPGCGGSGPEFNEHAARRAFSAFALPCESTTFSYSTATAPDGTSTFTATCRATK